MPSLERPLDVTARELGRLLDSVFEGLERLRADAEAIFSIGRATRSSLSALRVPVERFVVEQGELVDGAGVAVAPGVLEDSNTWLQWWRRDPAGGFSFAPHSFNPVSMNYYDYTSMPWFQRCSQIGEPGPLGPVHRSRWHRPEGDNRLRASAARGARAQRYRHGPVTGLHRSGLPAGPGQENTEDRLGYGEARQSSCIEYSPIRCRHSASSRA